MRSLFVRARLVRCAISQPSLLRWSSCSESAYAALYLGAEMQHADLNLSFLGDVPGRQPIAALVAEAYRLGYSIVAANYSTCTPLKPKDNCKFTAAVLPGSESAAAALSSSASASSASASRHTEPHAFDVVSALSATAGDRLTRRIAKLRRRQAVRADAAPSRSAQTVVEVAAGLVAGVAPAGGAAVGRKRPRPTNGNPASTDRGVAAGRGLVQLSRITVAAEAVRAVSDLFVGNSILQSYDLVAVAPGDPEVLRHAVASGVADIIRLDMSGGRLPFPLKADLVHATLAAGCVFELEYAPAIRDPTCRRFFVANAAELLRLTRGNGILLTSGAANALELRSPADAAAIAGLAGLSTRQCSLAMTAAAAQAIRHAEKRLTGALAGAAGAALPRGKPTGLTHGAVHAAASSIGGALVHIGTAPVALPRGLSLPDADDSEDDAVEAVAATAPEPAAGAGGATSASAAKKPRLAASAARGGSGGDEGLGADDDGNLMLLGAGAAGSGADEDDEDDGGASAAIAALAGAGLNRDRRKPRQQGKKSSSQGKQGRRQQLVAASQRQLLAVGSTMAREPAAAGASAKAAAASGGSESGTKARPWLGSAGARGLVAASPPVSGTAKGKSSGMQWAVPR